MIRVRISNFIKRNKDKISDLGIKLIIVAIVVFIATIVLSHNRNTDSNNQNYIATEIYTPKETVIKGKEVTEKQYAIDDNLVKNFMQYCNDGKVNEAYELISDDCKSNLYKTIDDFKEIYYNQVFKEKREYNLQSWISTNNYTVYKIRYTTNMLATGKYEEGNTFQDYITLIKNADLPKISIGNFVLAEGYNKETETKEIKARVIKKVVYIEDEEYEIEIRNKTQNTILLDNLNSSYNIKLLDKSATTYSAYINKIFEQDMKIMPEETKRIVIRFKKSCSSDKTSEYIQFSKVIRNYDDYIKNVGEYTGMFNLRIKV